MRHQVFHAGGGLLSTVSLACRAGDVQATLPTLRCYGACAVAPKWLLPGRVDISLCDGEISDGFRGTLQHLVSTFQAARRAQKGPAGLAGLRDLVEWKGIEPSTFALRTRRSPS